MATDAEIEAAKKAVRDEYGSRLCHWRAPMVEFIDAALAGKEPPQP